MLGSSGDIGAAGPRAGLQQQLREEGLDQVTHLGKDRGTHLR